MNYLQFVHKYKLWGNQVDIKLKRKRRKSMFTDYTKIMIKSGDGGNGAVTFRREKYVAAGRTRWRRWRKWRKYLFSS